MKYSNELKVGAALVAAVLIFIFGIRFFKDVPLLSGSYELRTQMVDAKGLISGNPVRTNGVKIGSVKSVSFDQQAGLVRVVMGINKGVTVPEGTTCEVTGIDALTGIRMEMNLGPLSNPPIPAGGSIPTIEEGGDLLADITNRAPEMVGRVDSVLVGLNQTIGTVHSMIGDPDSDVSALIASLRGSAATLNRLLASERDRISSILANVDSMTADLSTITGTQADSISRSITLLNRSLESMDRSMSSLENTTTQLDSMIGRINAGEGTIGKLINDPGLYDRLDSLATNLNTVVSDFKDNPRRYLRELKIVDIF